MAAAQNTADRVLELARGYLGTTDGSPFCRYYNQVAGTNIPLNSYWCACFVTYIMRMAGVPVTEIPNYCGCTTGTRQMRKFGTFRDRGTYTPKPGDVIMFDWNPSEYDGEDHTGIVERVSGGRVYSIEGNAGNNGVCMRRDYPLTSSIIVGFGVPKFENKKEDEDLNEQQTRKIAQEEAAKAAAKAVEAAKSAVYRFFDNVPKWAQPAIKYFMDAGIIEGVGKDASGKPILNLTEDLVRVYASWYKKEQKDNDTPGSVTDR